MHLKKILPWAVAGLGAAFVFWPRTAKAAAAGTTATVNVAQGLKMRAGPALTAAEVTALPNGMKVNVLQTGVKPTDNSGGEWWQIDAAGVTGYSRAVDPQGVHNFA